MTGYDMKILCKIPSGAAKDLVIMVFAIPLCIFLVLAPYSLLVGWKVFTVLLFWLIIVPGVALFLNVKLLKETKPGWKVVVGLTSFYGFMIMMTYQHHATDYFAVMMFSFVWNLLMIMVVMLSDRTSR